MENNEKDPKFKVGDHVTISKYIDIIAKGYLSNFLIGIHSMQGWTATTRYGVTRKRSTKRLQHTGNLFRKNLQLKDAC